MKRLRTFVALAAVGAIALACGGGDSTTNPSDGGTTTGPKISATAGNVFTPSTLSIAVGETVTWVFGPVDHNVIFGATAGAPSNIDITRNKSVSRTFSTAGTFAYVCSLHAGMTGSVTVH